MKEAISGSSLRTQLSLVRSAYWYDETQTSRGSRTTWTKGRCLHGGAGDRRDANAAGVSLTCSLGFRLGFGFGLEFGIGFGLGRLAHVLVDAHRAPPECHVGGREGKQVLERGQACSSWCARDGVRDGARGCLWCG